MAWHKWPEILAATCVPYQKQSIMMIMIHDVFNVFRKGFWVQIFLKQLELPPETGQKLGSQAIQNPSYR